MNNKNNQDKQPLTVEQQLAQAQESIRRLRVAVKIGVVLLHIHYRKDVENEFPSAQLNKIFKDTEHLRRTPVEKIFRQALKLK